MTTETPSLMYLTDRPLPIMDRGAGSWLYDEQQRGYLDFMQGWAVNALGHAPPELLHAISTQAEKLLTPSPALRNRPREELAERLCAATGLKRVHFCNSGAEANDCALKLVRKWGRVHKSGAFKVVTTLGGFHGRTLATAAASGKPGWDAIAPPNLEGFVKVPFGNLEAMANAIDETTCAVLLEPIQGEAGVIVPPHGYLQGLRQLTRERATLLLLDEIQTGCGRTGTFLNCQQHGVLPDVLTLGKGLGGGLPIAAVLATEECACFTPGDHGGTFGGNPLSCAVALALLSTISVPGFLASVRDRGRELSAGLHDLKRRWSLISEIRGAGLLWALRLERPVARSIADACFETGLLINAPHADTLRFMPQLRVSDEEIGLMLARLEAALLVVDGAQPHCTAPPREELQ